MLCIRTYSSPFVFRPSVADFESERNAVFAAEDAMFLGSDEILTDDEATANAYLMGLKVLPSKEVLIRSQLFQE